MVSDILEVLDHHDRSTCGNIRDYMYLYWEKKVEWIEVKRWLVELVDRKFLIEHQGTPYRYSISSKLHAALHS